jgi:hypothetical protein
MTLTHPRILPEDDVGDVRDPIASVVSDARSARNVGMPSACVADSLGEAVSSGTAACTPTRGAA